MSGEPMIPVDGILQMFPLAAILTLPANADVRYRSLYWDHTTDTLMHGPEDAREPVDVTGVEPEWLNMFGTSLNPSQDEETADAPTRYGDATERYGDTSSVTRITHTNAYEGTYDKDEPYWKSLRVLVDSFGIDRLIYQRFLPEGMKGGAEVWHGVCEPRGSSADFPRTDYATTSMDYPFRSRRYISDLPAVYPPPAVP